MAAHTRAWDQEFLILPWIYRGKNFSDPVFRVIIESWQSLFLVACTTSIDLKRLPPENQPDIGRPLFFGAQAVRSMSRFIDNVI
jgi:hypothetical protein